MAGKIDSDESGSARTDEAQPDLESAQRPGGINRRQFGLMASGLSATALLTAARRPAEAVPLIESSLQNQIPAKESPPVTQDLSPAPEFVPDWIFAGSSLADWKPLGSATWKAEKGLVSGTPTRPDGGWLILNRSFQDTQFFTRVRVVGDADAGLLLRAQETADGISGIFVSLREGDFHTYKVTLAADGKFLTRDVITDVTWGTIRTGKVESPDQFGAVTPAGSTAGGNRRRRSAPGDFMSGIHLPTPLPALNPPPHGLGKQPDGWDLFHVIYDSNIVRPYLNRTNQFAPSITGDTDGYGPVALYVGGSGTVHFKDICVKDRGVHVIEPEKISSNFRLQRLEEFYYSWGVAVGDINNDGHPDIVAGPYYYLGPDFKERHEIYLAQAYGPSLEYAPNMVTHVHDFRGQGWPDVLATEMRAMVLYENPKGENRRWKRHPVVPQISSEITVLQDLDGDGRPELVYAYQDTVMYAKYDPADPTVPWTVHQVSEPGLGYIHGLGVGDITGNGRMDIIGPAGWWEQPAAGSSQTLWTYHPVAFARWGRSEIAGGGQMFAYDVNGDGLTDVVTSLHAHGWGLAWFEQKRDGQGNISFVEHMIMDNYSTLNAGGVTFAELHAMTVADVDGDGIPDIITGKRYWAHQDSYFDPDSYGPPVLYWYRTVRNPNAPGGAEFVPEMIHNRSGVGSQIAAADLNHDGIPEVITATDRGTFIFWGKQRKKHPR